MFQTKVVEKIKTHIFVQQLYPKMFQTKVVEKIKTHFCSTILSENRAVQTKVVDKIKTHIFVQ
jgi:spore germination cell wall hydrolase CwlJ-like protein